MLHAVSPSQAYMIKRLVTLLNQTTKIPANRNIHHVGVMSISVYLL